MVVIVAEQTLKKSVGFKAARPPKRVLKEQIKWTPLRITIPLPSEYEGYAPREIRLNLDCLGDWTYHQAIVKEALSKDPNDDWRITHIPTGLVFVNARTAEEARQVVEFLAARWPRVSKLLGDYETLEEIKEKLEQARDEGALFFFMNWQTRDVLKPYDMKKVEKELIAALAG